MLSRSLVVSAQAIMLLLISLIGSTSFSVNTDRVVVAVPATVVDISSAAVADRVVFASDRHRTFYFNIYSMKADGTDVRRLTDGLAEDKTPAWSPDARQIAFTSDRSGNNEIYVMNEDGSNVIQVTRDAAFDWEPSWSPDGQHIAFTTNRDGNWEIYAAPAPRASAGANAAGSDAVRLTNSNAYDWQPAWSPDGRQIAFTSDRDGHWQIYLMNIDGSDVRRLTSSRGEDRDPAWSPDGQRIAFVSTRDRAWEIYVMYADGSGVARLTHSTKINQSPSWSSDGKYIIYESNSDIAMLRVDGSGVANLTNSPAADFQPQFAQLSP